MSTSVSVPTYNDILTAAARLQGVAHRTPVLRSAAADALADAELFFKCENFQRTGAFKFRGAYNAIAALSPSKRARGVITYSSGNHAQAIALAGRLLGVNTTILMPNDAPSAKTAATEGYGGVVMRYDRYRDNRDEICARLVADQGLTFVHPYDHRDVIAGQGTSARELFEECGDLDVLFVCLGGGGLLAGSALAAKALYPQCRLIGVEPEAGDDGRQSMRAGHVIRIAPPRSIADGAVVTHVGEHNFAIMKAMVDDVVTVSDDQLIETMRFLAQRMKVVVEPTGCLAAAAALSRAYHPSGARVGILVSGGNVDLAAYARHLQG